ncbi:MAG: SLBB domain-containing protein [Anaerolineae bacterium]|nr:SLBB domain-containing protein [Gloeobacterales cyanobacterium ES-bin-313]
MRSLSMVGFSLLLCAAPAWADVIVDVSGAVRAPGLIVVHDGATIREVIKAAGGAGSSADLTSIKLDQPITRSGASRTQLRVPFVGESKVIATASKVIAPASTPIAPVARPTAPKPADPTSQVRDAISQVRGGADAKQTAATLASQIKPNQRAQVFTLLQEAAGDKSVQVRLFAIAFLSETRDRQGMPVLIKALRDEDNEIRSIAGTILPEMAQRH